MLLAVVVDMAPNGHRRLSQAWKGRGGGYSSGCNLQPHSKMQLNLTECTFIEEAILDVSSGGQKLQIYI